MQGTQGGPEQESREQPEMAEEEGREAGPDGRALQLLFIPSGVSQGGPHVEGETW